MADRNKKLKANPIIEAVKTTADGKIHQLAGYIGHGEDGKIDLYLSLGMETCLELDEKDVIHFIEAESQPSLH